MRDISYSSFENVEIPTCSFSSEECAEKEVRSEPKHGDLSRGVLVSRWKKYVILVCLSVYWFISTCSFSMIAPFYPKEAESKGVSLTATGLVFAVFPLTMFIGSPIMGILIPIIGPKRVLIIGLILEGGTQIIFGFVHQMPRKDVFLAFSFVVRTLSAVGGCATSTSSLVMLTNTFESNMSPAVGVLEAFGGFGMMAGPPIGGLLYYAGGFKLPFLVVGCIALFTLLPLYFILPTINVGRQSHDGRKKFFSAVKIPAILLIATLVAVSGMCLSFLDPTLQKHLVSSFQLSTLQVGFVFLVGSGVYAVTAPGLGILADKTDTRYSICSGAVICGLTFPLLGPPPVIPIIPSALWLNCVALALAGFGLALLLVPALADMNASAKQSTWIGVRSVYTKCIGIHL
ncbi:MFS-type transporter SLC18B1-like isoform X2 [Rhopilema esculentum]|uniref:MFS-type transporter SLC18B1-like isoform X2 n=1 Tax=Rhopilema esculentum TaxID=499914 RepID=UPI0031D1543D